MRRTTTPKKEEKEIVGYETKGLNPEEEHYIYCIECFEKLNPEICPMCKIAKCEIDRKVMGKHKKGKYGTINFEHHKLKLWEPIYKEEELSYIGLAKEERIQSTCDHCNKELDPEPEED